MKKRRVVSLAAAASLLMVNGAYAAVPGNSVVLGNKAYDVNLLFKDEFTPEIQKAVGEAGQGLYYNLNGQGFKTIFGNTEVTDFTSWPQITYKDAAGAVTEYEAKNGDVVGTTLAVSSVSAINATTLRVTLTEAPTEAPTVGDFKIEVDGNTVVATAAVKVANETKKYDLTIPTLGSNEGALVVNGTAAAIDGSTFGYDFKTPTITSVTGIDKNHVSIVFSEKVNKTDAETVGNYELLKVSTGLKLDGAAAVAPTLAKLQADGKTVLLTTDGTMATFVKGYIATVKTGLKDAKGNATTANQSTFFDGVGNSSTQSPVVLSTVYNPSTTATVVVSFDKDINATVDKAKVKVGGSALALGDTVSRTGVAQLTITMTTTTRTAYEASADKTVVLEAGAVKDTETTPNEIKATTLTPVEAARLTAVAYDEASNKLTMTFNKSIDISAIDLTKVTLNGDVLTAASTTVNKLTQTANSATLEFTLSNAGDLTAVEGAVTTSRGLVIAAGFANDVDGNSVANYDYKAALTYTDDTTAPTVDSITYNATTNTMIITANEDVTIPDLDKLELYNGTTKLFDFETQKAALATGGTAIADGEASVEKKYTIVFSGAAETAVEASSVDKNNIKVKFLQAGTTTGQEALKDTAGNILAKDAEVAVNVVYTDQDSITLSGAITQVAADKIQLSFNKKVNTSDVTNVSKYKVVKKASSPEVVLPVLSAVVSGDGTSVILTLDKNSANYVNGYTYEVTSTVTDTFGNNYATPATATDDEIQLDTTTAATAYKLTGVAFVDTVADYAYGAGDQLKLTFNGPVSLSGDVVAGDFDLANMTLGTGFTVVQGASTAELVVTLGTGAALTGTAFDASQTIDLAAAGQTHVVGANGIAAVENGANIAIAKPDTTKPKVVSAQYNDANGNGTQDAGDTIQITFDENVKFLAEDITAKSTGTGVDFLLDGGADLVLDGTKASVDGKVFTAEIKTVGTVIVPGTTTIQGGDDAPNAVLDLWGNALVNDAGKVIIKSDSAQPTFSNVQVTKGTGKTGLALEAGDKVVFTISEPVHKEGSFDLNSLVFYAGSTAIKYNTDNHLLIDSGDAGNDGTGANTSAVVIDNLAKTVTITIAANDGWEAATISSLSTFNIDTLGKATFADANGNEIQTASGFGLTVTK